MEWETLYFEYFQYLILVLLLIFFQYYYIGLYLIILFISINFILKRWSTLKLISTYECMKKDFKKSKFELTQTKVELQQLLDINPCIMFTLKNEEFSKINKAVTKKLGLSLNQLKNKNILDITHQDDKIVLKKYLDESMLRKLLPIHVRFKTIADIYLTFDLNINYSNNKHYIIACDITNEEELEQKMKDKEKIFSNFFEFNHTPIVIFDTTNLTYKDVNHAFADLLGYNRDYMVGKSYTAFIDPDYIKAAENVAKKNSSEFVISSAINRYRKKDGSFLLLKWELSPRIFNMTYAVVSVVEAIEY